MEAIVGEAVALEIPQSAAARAGGAMTAAQQLV